MMLYGVGWFSTVVIIRLSQPSIAGVGAELGKIGIFGNSEVIGKWGKC